MLSSITELHTYIDRSQLTQELGGTQEYCHEKWISHRTVRTLNTPRHVEHNTVPHGRYKVLYE